MKDDWMEIRTYVEELKRVYGFQGPLHFTDFTNLGTIFTENNIYSRNGCSNNNIKFLDVADQSVISNTKTNVKNYVRFYYKEKPMTLYINEGVKEDNQPPHIPIPVYLLFDEELLYCDDTVFSDGNAASSNTKYGHDFTFFSNMDWSTIFDRGAFFLEDGPIKQEFKRKRQAELLSRIPVSLDYLRKVIFRSNADYKRACMLFGSNDMFVVDKKMFNNNRNYIDDYTIKFEYNGNYRTLSLIIKTNIDLNTKGKYEIRIINEIGTKILTFDIPVNYPNKKNIEINILNLQRDSFRMEFWLYGVLSIEEEL